MGASWRLISALVRELRGAIQGERRCYRVEGDSMSPSLLPGDLIWVTTYTRGLPSPGDVVVVRDPQDLQRILVKRARSCGAVTFSVGSDNPTSGRDSRHFGSLGIEHLIGRAILSCSPSSLRIKLCL